MVENRNDAHHRLAEAILLGAAVYGDFEGRATNVVLHPYPDIAEQIAKCIWGLCMTMENKTND